MSNQSSTVLPSDQEISRQIHQFVLTKLLEGEQGVNLTDRTPLVSGGVIDSLSSRKVGLFLERRFNIRVAPEELADPEHMETIAAMTALVRSKLRLAS